LAACNAALERELALAAADSFYLVLDLSASELVLKRKGAILQTYLVHGSELGTPRRGFGSAKPAASWWASVWTEGRTRPPLAAVQGPQEDETALPPTPEEAYPAPDAWRVDFREGLTLEVLTPQADRGRGLFGGLATLFGGSRPRIRLTMETEIAGRLYRGLPPGIAFLVRPRVPREASGRDSAANPSPVSRTSL